MKRTREDGVSQKEHCAPAVLALGLPEQRGLPGRCREWGARGVPPTVCAHSECVGQERDNVTQAVAVSL